ncbi:ribonucleoside-triphosphate reductase [Bacillus subtilis]|uniref:ribonucleoside-triphosphate reductase n=1 Tax=Bacillus subtilis TaxID=1423 RepID=UPI00100A14CF|nr:ribonucleoside-triphosphate reductase [Bacillus subtilis]QAV89969.1 ribonucleoside-triphosphate reductase [Bacillus subtilis]
MSESKLLRLNSLQFFSEPTEPAANEPTEPTAAAGSEETPPAEKTFTQEELNRIVTERVDREKKKYADYEDLKAQLAALEDKTKADSSALEKYAEVEARKDALEGTLTKLFDSKITGIPEEFHDLIPSDGPIEQRLDWVVKAEEKGLFAPKAKTPLGKPSNPQPDTSEHLSKLSPRDLIRKGYAKNQ